VEPEKVPETTQIDKDHRVRAKDVLGTPITAKGI
jgi:hypothetical protein